MATDTLEKSNDKAHEEKTGEKDGTTPAPRKSAPVTRRGMLPRVVGGVLVAALIAAAGFFGYQYFAGDSGGSASSEGDAAILSVANDYAIKLSSFDYRDLDKNRAEITAMSTEDFGKKYGEMVAALTEIVSNGKGEATAEVSHGAVESVDGDEATVLLFVDQKAKNVVAPEGRSQPYRMVVKLKKVDDNWLVNDVQTV